MSGYKIRCRNCNHERIVTEAWLQTLIFSKTKTIEIIDENDLKREIRRLKCSQCGAKEAEYIEIEKNNVFKRTYLDDIKTENSDEIKQEEQPIMSSDYIKPIYEHYCVDCGEAIPIERVQANPNVIRCVQCQIEFEKIKGYKRRIIWNDGIAGSREDNKRMRARDWGDMRKRSKGQ